MVSVWRSAKHVAMPGFAVWAQTRAVGWTAAAVADCAVAGSAGAVKARAAKPAMARTLRGERRMDHSPGEILRMVGPHGCAVYTATGLLLKSVTDSALFVPAVNSAEWPGDNRPGRPVGCGTGRNDWCRHPTFVVHCPPTFVGSPAPRRSPWWTLRCLGCRSGVHHPEAGL